MKRFVKHIQAKLQSKKHQDKVYIVYTMGKVGSLTVYSGLGQSLPGAAVFHLHFLSERALNHCRTNPDLMINVDRATEVFDFLEQNPRRKKRYISLVREPVGRMVSNLFENPFLFIEGELSDYTPQELSDIVQEKDDHSYTLNWFDDEFMAYTGYNIYDRPFDKTKGYSILEMGNGDQLLLIKLEALNKVFGPALDEFCGAQVVKAGDTNVRNKDVRYSEVRDSIKIPLVKLEELYSSKFVQHFYTEEEISTFLLRWQATTSQ